MIAYKTMSNTMGIAIDDLPCGDGVIWRWSNEKKQHRAEIKYTPKGRAYFIAGKTRQYLDEYMRRK